VALFQEINEEVLLANAESLLANLALFRYPELPERPEALRYSDQELWTAHRKREREEKIVREDREQLQSLGSWRSAVRILESRAAGYLLAMLGVLRRLETTQRNSEAGELREFIRAQYRCRVPEPCPAYTSWLRRFAEHFAMNRDLLPMHLRRMTRPPEGEGWLPEQRKGQRSMPYAEDED
jgi:hypothetical protein